MYVIILGAGNIGYSIAEILINNRHEVGVIDSNESKCNYIDSKLGSISILGDGTLPDTLIKAGITRADIFIATTKKDHENMLACQLAKENFKAKFTICITHSKEITSLFETLNINYSININQIITKELITKIKSLGININVSNNE